MSDVFQCSACQHVSATWTVCCAGCGRANALFARPPVENPRAHPGEAPRVDNLASLEPEEHERIPSGFVAFDSALGGGYVPGSVILLAGAPGSGKSTLALQSCDSVSLAGTRSLYVTVEETKKRLRERVDRCNLDASQILTCSYPEILTLGRVFRKERPRFAVIDSLHVTYSDTLRARPGSPSQLIECASAFVRLAQSMRCAILLVGHVTKKNQLSGPRNVEHAVDVMIAFTVSGTLRILTPIKNRFGATGAGSTMKMTPFGVIDTQEETI